MCLFWPSFLFVKMFLSILSKDGETEESLEDDGEEVKDITLDWSRPESFAVFVQNISSLVTEVFDDEDEGVGEIAGNCL